MDSTDQLAKIIWDYHHMNHQLQKADCVIVLGSNDVRVAEYAAELYKEGWAPLLVFSGHKGQLTEDWDRPEAEVYAEAAIAKGVPTENILIENQSTNTGQNIVFSRSMLEEQGEHPKRVILVHKPYMERRTYATMKKVWPEVESVITSPPIPFEQYPNATIPKDIVYNQMVADLQRIMLYPARGFQIPQDIPDAVVKAYDELVRRGFTKRMINNSNK